jgi:hypothetical protein
MMAKQFYDSGKAEMRSSQNTRTSYDHLPLPQGAKVVDLGNAQLASVLAARGVPGISHSNGREENLKAYAVHLDKIRKEAADKAEEQWLATQ